MSNYNTNPQKTYKHLNILDRDILIKLKIGGLGPSQIAKIIGKDRSTIYRELKRNAPPINSNYYLPHIVKIDIRTGSPKLNVLVI